MTGQESRIAFRKAVPILIFTNCGAAVVLLLILPVYVSLSGDPMLIFVVEYMLHAATRITFCAVYYHPSSPQIHVPPIPFSKCSETQTNTRRGHSFIIPLYPYQT